MNPDARLGYRSLISLDLSTKRAVVVLSDVGISVDAVGADPGGGGELMRGVIVAALCPG